MLLLNIQLQLSSSLPLMMKHNFVPHLECAM